jgi:hypothetical protein
MATLDETLRLLERRGGSMRDRTTLKKRSIALALARPLRGGARIRADIDGDLQAEVHDALVSNGWAEVETWLRKEWVIASAADRARLRSELIDALDTIGPGLTFTFAEDVPGSDAGFGQVGCALIAVSAPVGALVGFLVVLATKGFDAALPAGAIGLAAGLLSGGFIAWGGLRAAERIRRLRAKADEVGLIAAFIGSGIVALVVALVIGVTSSA